MRKPSPKEKAEYQARAELRYLIRQFLSFTEEAARDQSLTARQHEVLIAIMAAAEDPTISDLAERLVIKHHSAVGLVDRLQEAGLVERRPHSRNHREVVVCITPKAIKLLKSLTPAHRRELKRIAPLMRSVLKGLQ